MQKQLNKHNKQQSTINVGNHTILSEMRDIGIDVLEPGTTLSNGKYVIDGVLGQGGFGITYKAYSKRDKREYAIKELFVKKYNLRNTSNNNVEVREINTTQFNYFITRFEDEAKALQSIDCDLIVKVYDFFRENGTAYMVMSYVKGETLKDIVNQNGRMDCDTAVNYITQVCDAVQYIHSKNILHRDIAHDNIIVTSRYGENDSIVLIDFGSARTFVDGQINKHTIFIKEGFSPIEQGKEVFYRGASSDIYSLGAVFYYILTGCEPQSAEKRKKNDKLSFPEDVPVWIRNIINKAMKIESKERYQSVDEMIDDIMQGGDEPITNSQDDDYEDAVDGQTIQDELPNGTKLQGGKYVIEKVLGKGGFGITYLATNVKLNGKCAIKEFFLEGYNVRHTESNRVYLQRLETQKFEDSKRSFNKEAETLFRLHHPNIVRVLDFFQENGTEYMVMEFVEGETLQEKVSRGPLSERGAVNYICQVLEALSYIHNEKDEEGKGLLHRDISPDNIIITPRQGDIGRAVLIDFGNARRFIENKTQRQTTIVKHGYAPCEMYSGTSRKGAFSDLYSVGAVLYFILTGIQPAESNERFSNPESFIEPIKLNKKVSENINGVIVKAMEMQSIHRYQSAEAMLNDIKNGKIPEKVSERGNKKSPFDNKDKRGKSKVLIYLAIAIGVVAVLFALFVVERNWNRYRYSPPAPAAEKVDTVYEIVHETETHAKDTDGGTNVSERKTKEKNRSERKIKDTVVNTPQKDTNDVGFVR